MDKYFFGKLLGETYRTQRRLNIPTAGEATIFGLLNGIETVVDKELTNIEPITKEDISNTCDVLDKYFLDLEEFEKFDGFYTIEHQLEEVGVSRWKAIVIFQYFKANNQYVDLIKKMDSFNSPSECRTFELDDWDK